VFSLPEPHEPVFQIGIIAFFLRERIYLIAIRCFRFALARFITTIVIAVKHATMASVLLFVAKTVHSHAAAAMGRGISRRERILKSPLWDPAG